GGRAVLLVVCVQDQQQVKSLDHIWIRDVWLGSGAEAQAQEVLDHVHRVVRVQQCLATRLLVGVGWQNRQLGEQAQGRTLDVCVVLWIERILVRGRQGRNSRGQHWHWVRIAWEAAEEALEVFVQQGVAAQRVVEVGKL